MLIGALGCNLAWGVIDGLFYLLGTLAEKGRNLKTLQAIRAAVDAAAGRRLIAEALPDIVAEALSPTELEAVRERLTQRTGLPDKAGLGTRDWLASLSVFAWVFLVTFPVAIPFMFMSDADLALRVSNGVAVGLLFFVGFAYGRCIGRNPWAVAAGLVLVGAVVVAMTIALGG
jgi:VIT1/CCC1 family predicted Fe2+/Mn2+ transporter